MNAINWFEIPVANFERAVTFYERILNTTLHIDTSFPGMRMAIFPHECPSVGGALFEHAEARPHADGVRIYLNGGKRGYLIGVDPADVVRVLQPTLVNVAVVG